MKKKTVAVIVSLLLCFGMFNMTSLAAANDITISNPYATVDWATYGQYKADFHSHSVESDGGNQPADMFEDHYAKGFDIQALTDHNFVNTTWDRTDRTATYLTTERLAEINAGVGRDGRGMIGIPYSDEQSIAPHLNTFWADFNNQSGATLESNIAQCEALGGISHINHPGRYTGGVSTANNGADGAAASSDPTIVAYYVGLFENYDSCVGMEIINKKDGDSYSDRILWDNILEQTMPFRPVWGFSNDDTHSVSATGFSYNMMLMPENTLENVRYSMENGTFYAVAKVAKRELGMNFVASGPTPVISNIVVDDAQDSITISGDYYHTIEWVANGVIIATGNTLDINDYENVIGNYVRAQLKGVGGISFTQPFGIMRSDSHSVVGATVDPTFTVTIPTSVNFGSLMKNTGIQEQPFVVTMSDSLLETGAHVDVNVFSTFLMTAGSAILGYDLFNEAAVQQSNGSTYTSFTADGSDTGKVTVDTAEITKAGAFSGTMLFNFTYVG